MKTVEMKSSSGSNMSSRALSSCRTAVPLFLQCMLSIENQQQAKRRERRWKERQAQAVKFLHDICDAQLKRGDHVLAELPFGEHWGVKTLAQSMIKHPNIQCVYG